MTITELIGRYVITFGVVCFTLLLVSLFLITYMFIYDWWEDLNIPYWLKTLPLTIEIICIFTILFLMVYTVIFG